MGMGKAQGQLVLIAVRLMSYVLASLLGITSEVEDEFFIGYISHSLAFGITPSIDEVRCLFVTRVLRTRPTVVED